MEMEMTYDYPVLVTITPVFTDGEHIARGEAVYTARVPSREEVLARMADAAVSLEEAYPEMDFRPCTPEELARVRLDELGYHGVGLADAPAGWSGFSAEELEQAKAAVRAERAAEAEQGAAG